MKRFFHCLGLLVVAIFLTSCAKNSPTSNLLPTLKIADSTISSLSLDTLGLSHKLEIYNPLPLGFSPKNITLRLYYDNKLVIQNKIDDNITLKAQSNNNVVLKSSVKILDLINIISDYNKRDTLPFRVEITLGLPLIGQFSFFENMTLSDSFAFQVPTLKPELSLKQISHNPPFGVNVAFNIKDKSKFSLSDIKYNLKLDKQYFSGVATSRRNSDGSTDIEISNLNILNLITAKFSDIALQMEGDIKFDSLGYAIPIRVDKEF